MDSQSESSLSTSTNIAISNKASFKIEKEIKTFQGKKKLNEFMTTKLTLQNLFKEILPTDEIKSEQISFEE